MEFFKRYIKRLIDERLLEMKITSVKVVHSDPGKIEVSIQNCCLISGGCCIETVDKGHIKNDS